jgi:hypothetical protein
MTAPTKPVVGVTTVGSQKDRRYLDTFYDQHRSTRFPNGRPWWGYREIAANRDMNPNLRDGFCGGELIPGRHPDEGESRESAWRDLWSAPWVAEYRFFQLDYKRSRINIRYDLQMGYDQVEEEKYFRAAALICIEKGWRETKYGERPRWEVRAVLGDPPRSPQIARAAQSGDEWILGISQRQNPHLATLLGLTPAGLPVPDRFEPKVQSDDVITMTRAELQDFIASELARLVSKGKKPQHRPGATPEQMAKLRELAAQKRSVAETAAHSVPEGVMQDAHAME